MKMDIALHHTELKNISVAPGKSPGTFGPPSQIQLIPYGRHITDKGSFNLDAPAIEAVLSSFKKRKNQMAIDYEHQSLGSEEAPAAGWIKRLLNKGRDGLWAEVDWTERAKRYLRGREYRYLSPVFLKELDSGNVVRLLGAGLTNRPAIDGMVPVVNTEGSPLKTNKEEELMEELLKVLGLDPGSTENDVLEAVTRLKQEAATENISADVLEAIGLDESAGRSEALGTIAAMRHGYDLAEELTSKVQELGLKLKNTQAESLVTTAMREGKVTPAQRPWALDFAGRDPEGFLTFAAKAPAAISIGVMEKIAFKHSSAVDETQERVNRLTGVSRELFKKHNK
jgi:phage I-like protein